MMGVDYTNELSSKLKRSLFDRLLELEKNGTMKPQEISNILLGLAKMGAKFADLPEYSRASLLHILDNKADRLNDQEIANSIYR